MGNKKTWVRGQVDASTHSEMYQAKLKINSQTGDGVRIEDIATECIKLGLPLYKKKMGV